MMHSRSRLLFMVLLLVVGTLALPWAASAQEPVTSRLKLSIGGYIKPEFLYRTNQGAVSSIGSPPGLAHFGFSQIAQHSTIGGENGAFTAAASESRFNFTLTAPDWRGIRPTAFLEGDFQASTAESFARYNATTASPGSGNPFNNQKDGAFRIRHAFMRLAGEGMGGSWDVTFGHTWSVFGMLPYYAGSTVSFGGATIFGHRTAQLTLRHTVSLMRDLRWENAIGAAQDNTSFNEVPAGNASSRFIYTGWQGWQGGARTPLNLGVSATIQRQKADVAAPTTGAAATTATSASTATRTLSNVAWGVTGGVFVPILPGTSATDRTWAMSVVGEGGYGEGVQGLIPGTNPWTTITGLTLGVGNRADPGAVFFRPGKCNSFTNLGGLAAAAVTTPGNPCGAGAAPTELSMLKTPWASWNLQFYLPANFWLSGGQKWIWFPNADNAVAATALGNGPTIISPGNNQGQISSAGVLTCTAGGNCQALYTGRDSLIKRLHYNYVALFYDMTPNIRWGVEYGYNGTNRKNSVQDNQSNQFQIAAYYFF